MPAGAGRGGAVDAAHSFRWGRQARGGADDAAYSFPRLPSLSPQPQSHAFRWRGLSQESLEHCTVAQVRVCVPVSEEEVNAQSSLPPACVCVQLDIADGDVITVEVAAAAVAPLPQAGVTTSEAATLSESAAAASNAS